LAENLGFAGGANAGAKQAVGEVIGFLNDDAVAESGWLSSAARALEDATVAAVGPKVALAGRYLEICLEDETIFSPGDPRPLGRRITSANLGGADVLSYLVGPGIHSLESGARQGEERWRWTTGGEVPFYVLLPEGSSAVELRLNGELVRPFRVVDLVDSVGYYLQEDGYVGSIGSEQADDETFESWEERFALAGMGLVTTREVFEKVGGFETRYFTRYEDTDWCWRAQLQGYRLLFDPTTVVRHERGASSGGVLSRRAHFLSERNRLLTLIRNAPVGIAARETWKKRHANSDDGVAEVIPRFVPRAVCERLMLSRSWVLNPREVEERWAGVDVPAGL
jgi:GT2 family glycosyltransferase